MRGLRARDGLFLALALIVAAACVRLGFWQLARLAERRASNALIGAQLALPPLTLTGAADPQAQPYRRVVVRGRFDPEREVLLSDRALNGVSGYHLLTPLWLEGSQTAVLVDRGWIPIDAGTREARARYAAVGTVEIKGILRASQPEPTWSILADPTRAPGAPPLESWRLVNIPRLQAQIPYPLLPFYIEETERADRPELTHPDPDIDLSDGPHLSYAIQWFAFAAIALFGGGLWLRRRLGRPPGGPSQE